MQTVGQLNDHRPRARRKQLSKSTKGLEFTLLPLDDRRAPDIRPSGSRSTVENVLTRLGGNWSAALVAGWCTDAREKDAQVVVDLGDRADSASWVSSACLLLNRDRRGQPRNRIDIGLGHLAEKLSSIRRQRFDVSPLALGIEGIKSQGTFA